MTVLKAIRQLICIEQPSTEFMVHIKKHVEEGASSGAHDPFRI